MDVKLSEKKCTVDNAVKAYAEKKVGKLERYFRGDAEALVTFRTEKKNACRVELTVHASNTYFRAEETTTDMMASIDAAVATIEGQIRKNKTRLAKRLRTDAFSRTPQAEAEVPAADPEFQVVRTKKISIKPMSKEEAILQMNLLGHSFFVFRDDEENGAFAVVYARKDGGYGLIEDIDL